MAESGAVDGRQNPMRCVMLSTRKLAAIVAVAAVAASSITFAQTMPDRHSMEADQHQMTQSGPHQMDPGQMKEMTRQHQGMMRAHADMHATSTHRRCPARMPSEQSRKSCRSSTLTRRPIGQRSISKRYASISST